MIREAIDRIIGLASPNEFKYSAPDADPVYFDKTMSILRFPDYPTIKCSTLSALKTLIENNAVHVIAAIQEPKIVHVCSPSVVRFIGHPKKDGQRDVFCKIELDLGIDFEFGEYHELQSFIIALQTCFVPNANLQSLLEFLSSIVVGENGQFDDNGLYQNITVKVGIAAIDKKQITPRVALRPYRTFTEVDQPESTFLFRIRVSNDAKSIACGLFCCDGNAWRQTAMASISAWIKDNIKSDFAIVA
jgi:hypothetical protein